jgi:hypothetical protein
MNDNTPTKFEKYAALELAVTVWRDAREAIFRSDAPTIEMHNAYSNAADALMLVARALNTDDQTLDRCKSKFDNKLNFNGFAERLVDDTDRGPY